MIPVKGSYFHFKREVDQHEWWNQTCHHFSCEVKVVKRTHERSEAETNWRGKRQKTSQRWSASRGNTDQQLRKLKKPSEATCDTGSVEGQRSECLTSACGHLQRLLDALQLSLLRLLLVTLLLRCIVLDGCRNKKWTKSLLLRQPAELQVKKTPEQSLQIYCVCIRKQSPFR